MKKSKQETILTRVRIVEAASSEFRRNGIDRTGLNELMAAAGLTRGGFYRHFSSKDQLVSEAYGHALQSQLDRIVALTADAKRTKALQAAVDMYLSNAQRDDPATSCPLAMLGSELPRSSEDTRSKATEGIRKFSEILGTASGASTANEAIKAGLPLLATLVGALTMSRVVLDDQLSEEIINEAKKAVSAYQRRKTTLADTV
ncbi:TetR/AcrR family transcriptional regulator [Komagataeibacter xylinus]|uniref:TetR/AcrR family transcriptional regulator n=1 Tax=Komagataeibacter xylinus TaxID=28448 RepID=UPI00280B4D79|nr:TetR/AcrR family transcriptional regulator [Komagataeibacter xylinus]